jgi:hypothetical protein
MGMTSSTRRRFVVGTGAVGIGTLGTLWFTGDAEAVSVSFGELNIPDAEHVGDAESVAIDVDADIQWDASRPIDMIALTLATGDTNNQPTEIASTELQDVANSSGDTTATLSGDVLDSASLARSDFELLTGQPSRQQQIEVVLTARIISESTELAQASVSDTATITVMRGNATIEIAAEGELQIS